MKKYEELFYLIKSLSKSEKRYFKLDAQKEENSFVRLFEAIDEQKSYDEGAIKALFKDEPFVKQLTTMKNYLKNKILRSLRNFYANQSVNTQLHHILLNVEVLYNKGLYEVCRSELKRAEKYARSFQNHLLMIQITDWNRRIHQALHPADLQGIRKYVEIQKEQQQITTDYLDLLLANTDPAHFSILHKRTPTLLNKTLQELYNYQRFLYDDVPEQAEKTLRELIAEWNKHPELLQEYFAMYLSVNNNYLAYLVYRKNYQEALRHIQRMKGAEPNKLRHTAIIAKETLRRINTEMEIYRDAKMINEAEQFIPEMKAYLENYHRIVPENYRLSFQFQFAYTYFLKKDFDKALLWINETLNDPNSKTGENLFLLRNTHWLNLLVHFELDSGFALRYYIDGMKRFLQKQGDAEEFEQVLLKSLPKISDMPSRREQQAAFVELYETLAHMQIPDQSLRMVNFKEWIQEKIGV